jgi:hypothetical protein
MARTGPRSAQAKAIVSTNAVRHGLRSPRVVIPGLEHQADWDTFLKDSFQALKPVGAVEYALAERIASLLWRLRRASRAELNAAIAAGQGRDSEEHPAQQAVEGMVLSIAGQLYPGDESDIELIKGPRAPPPSPPDLLPVARVLQNLSRHEYRLNRQLIQLIHEYYIMQDRRNGNDAPIARVDVEVDVHGLSDG